MPDRILTLEAAKTRLILLTQAEVHPVIDQEVELPDILERAVNATIWVEETAYSVGDVVQPSTSNGHRYVCVQAGTSDAEEPDWTLAYRGRNSDGTTLVWEEAGDEYLSLWDMDLAASLGWELKAMKALKAVNTSQGEQSFDFSLIYDRCMEMAERFRPVMIA